MAILHMDGFDHYEDEVELDKDQILSSEYPDTTWNGTISDIHLTESMSRNYILYENNVSEFDTYAFYGGYKGHGFFSAPGKNGGMSMGISYQSYSNTGNGVHNGSSLYIGKNIPDFYNSDHVVIGLSFFPIQSDEVKTTLKNSFTGQIFYPTILGIYSQVGRKVEDGFFSAMYGKSDNKLYINDLFSNRIEITGVIYNSWNILEVKIDIKNEKTIVRLNGDEFELPFTQTNKEYVTNKEPIKIVSGNFYSYSTIRYYYRYLIDDLYILDSTGTTNNDFLGNVTVNTRLPDKEIKTEFKSEPSNKSNSDIISSAYNPDKREEYTFSNTGSEEDIFSSSSQVAGNVYAVEVGILARKLGGDSKNLSLVLSNDNTEIISDAYFDLDKYTGTFKIYNTDTDGNQWTKNSVETSKFGYRLK